MATKRLPKFYFLGLKNSPRIADPVGTRIPLDTVDSILEGRTPYEPFSIRFSEGIIPDYHRFFFFNLISERFALLMERCLSDRDRIAWLECHVTDSMGFALNYRVLKFLEYPDVLHKSLQELPPYWIVAEKAEGLNVICTSPLTQFVRVSRKVRDLAKEERLVGLDFEEVGVISRAKLDGEEFRAR